MSTRPTRQRPYKPTKKSAEEPAPEPVPEPTPTEVPVEAAPAAEEPSVESTATEEDPKGKKGPNLGTARVRRYLDKLTLNQALGEQTAPLKQKLAEYRAAAKLLETKKNADGSDATPEQLTTASALVAAPELEDLKARLAALSSEKIRFSSDASLVLSIVCDEAVKQLLKHAIDSAVASNVKTAKVVHLHAAGVENLMVYPLVKNLPSFSQTSSDLSAETLRKNQELALHKTLAQAERSFRKKYGVKVQKEPAQPAPAAADVPEAEPQVKAVKPKKLFKHFVATAKKFLQAKYDIYDKIKVSEDLKFYLSDLIAELINRLAPLIMLTTKAIKNKTVSGYSILKTIELLFVDGHVPVETVELKQVEEGGKSVYRAFRTVSFPTSSFGQLQAVIDANLPPVAPSA